MRRDDMWLVASTCSLLASALVVVESVPPGSDETIDVEETEAGGAGVRLDAGS